MQSSGWERTPTSFTCHRLHGQHQCFFPGIGNSDLTPIQGISSQKESGGPRSGSGLDSPTSPRATTSCHRCYAAGRLITCLSKAVSVSHKSQITCQNCAVGRLPGCSAAAFVLHRAWDGRQLPASPCQKENEVEIWRKPFK